MGSVGARDTFEGLPSKTDHLDPRRIRRQSTHFGLQWSRAGRRAERRAEGTRRRRHVSIATRDIHQPSLPRRLYANDPRDFGGHLRGTRRRELRRRHPRRCRRTPSCFGREQADGRRRLFSWGRRNRGVLQALTHQNERSAPWLHVHKRGSVAIHTDAITETASKPRAEIKTERDPTSGSSTPSQDTLELNETSAPPRSSASVPVAEAASSKASAVIGHHCAHRWT